jgi:hypothetical protein
VAGSGQAHREDSSAVIRPPTFFTIAVLRYIKTYVLTRKQLAIVSVVRREWALKNPCRGGLP